tara:strand:+ start:941 stop:1711 length:771 start_codon:yes stop_codon:yes gene_type:complete
MQSNKQCNILGIIPARMGSTRFPGKPMAEILGKPMIGHVYDNVKKNSLINEVAVATCDDEIYNYIESIGGKAVMTSDAHERASDRCAEAMIKIENSDNKKYDIVIMIQGDEPMIHPDMITEAISPMLDDPKILITNLLGKIESNDEFEDKNCIKVVCDLNNNALYFSREPIPTRAKEETIPMGKQICVIPFRRDFLIEYNGLEQTPLEIAESVDMIRILEHGLTVRMVPTNYQTHAVDTPDDLEKVSNLVKNSIPS